eukprot:11089966-Lingulodinium_polyedra.AAC.1
MDLAKMTRPGEGRGGSDGNRPSGTTWPRKLLVELARSWGATSVASASPDLLLRAPAWAEARAMLAPVAA